SESPPPHTGGPRVFKRSFDTGCIQPGGGHIQKGDDRSFHGIDRCFDRHSSGSRPCTWRHHLEPVWLPDGLSCSRLYIYLRSASPAADGEGKYDRGDERDPLLHKLLGNHQKTVTHRGLCLCVYSDDLQRLPGFRSAPENRSPWSVRPVNGGDAECI